MKLYYYLLVGAALCLGLRYNHVLILGRRNELTVQDCIAPVPSIKPRSSVGTFKDAYYHAYYAGVTYCEPSNIQNWSCSYCKSIGDQVKAIAVVDDTNYQTRGFIAIDRNRKEIILSFRGSVNLPNWIQNLKLVKKKFKRIPGAEVHTGFMEAADGLLPLHGPIIRGIISQYIFRDYKIVVVGHSLGGAIALLSAINLQEYLNQPWSRFSVFTYGQPRIGNLAFSLWVNSLPFTMTRVVNENDMVPHEPKLELCYIHHHTEVWVDHNITRFCGYGYMEDPQCSQTQINNLSSEPHTQVWDIPLGTVKC